MTINARCFTNLDEFRQVDWPEVFVALPRVGDRVQGHRSGTGPGTSPVLKVVAITHCVVDDSPRIYVELHR